MRTQKGVVKDLRKVWLARHLKLEKLRRSVLTFKTISQANEKRNTDHPKFLEEFDYTILETRVRGRAS